MQWNCDGDGGSSGRYRSASVADRGGVSGEKADPGKMECDAGDECKMKRSGSRWSAYVQMVRCRWREEDGV